MENTKSHPIVIDQPGMRLSVAHRSGLGGNDEGLTFDVTTVGPENAGERILRFDCFYKNPHYHIGASGGESAAYKMKDEGIEDPVRWTLEQLKTRFPPWSNKPATKKSPRRSISRRLPISLAG
jgi:hypothetical protein